jgi:hypothetical protein
MSDGDSLVNNGPGSLVFTCSLHFSFQEPVIDYMLRMQILYVRKVRYVIRLLDKSIGA